MRHGTLCRRRLSKASACRSCSLAGTWWALPPPGPAKRSLSACPACGTSRHSGMLAARQVRAIHTQCNRLLRVRWLGVLPLDKAPILNSAAATWRFVDMLLINAALLHDARRPCLVCHLLGERTLLLTILFCCPRHAKKLADDQLLDLRFRWRKCHDHSGAHRTCIRLGWIDNVECWMKPLNPKP